MFSCVPVQLRSRYITSFPLYIDRYTNSDLRSLFYSLFAVQLWCRYHFGLAIQLSFVGSHRFAMHGGSRLYLGVIE